jgi:hypothetical protein
MTNHTLLSTRCTGPNPACRKAHRDGRSVHVIPAIPSMDDFVIENDRARKLTPSLVMPTNHYATAAEGVAAIELAMRTAPTVTCDDDLYACRRMGIPHFLPVGWIDPTRR